ncbi:Transcriptional regulatory protein RcsB [Paraburkholderia sediminicola]|uniref:Transcriptional regulatory protein RcsB n=1 Tax=Paraburkholderia sediminicola TaxID=458836 RepID=A0A6J5C7K6_9BURK|nr:response regulator transcription factor [Paraburkholderia sediminicola]CAB3729705.1 Transcriptional regulatory protein RcsB [Paraburkholderia sediminicola]
MKINLVLADDHPALIAGIKHELSGIHTLNVAGTARNSTEIVELLSRVPCDILVTDYAMPGGEFGDGITLLSFLRRRYPDLKIIVFTTISNPAMVQEMSKLGIRSVLNKIDDVGHLISAIHTVYAGSAYFSPTTQTQDAATAHGRMSETSVRQLTKREAEVVRLYVSGLSINEIASQLHRTKQTISSQKMSAMRKLGIERDADLFRFAYEAGLVVTTEPQQDT